jgi:hypothetical protein
VAFWEGFSGRGAISPLESYPEMALLAFSKGGANRAHFGTFVKRPLGLRGPWPVWPKVAKSGQDLPKVAHRHMELWALCPGVVRGVSGDWLPEHGWAPKGAQRPLAQKGLRDHREPNTPLYTTRMPPLEGG